VTARSPLSKDVFLGRQPIFGRGLEVYAYELLYRTSGELQSGLEPGGEDGNRATSRVLMAAFTEIGLDRVTGDRPAFVNLTRGFITGEHPLPLAADRLVLEVLEDIRPDAEIMAGLRKLSSKGYRIALDDFVLQSDTRELLDVADIVKLDYQTSTREELTSATREIKGRGIMVLGEKIETQEEFEVGRELGFDLFQGYFLAKPRILQGRSLPSNALAMMQILAELQKPDSTPEKVSELVERDVAMSYRLLKHINSTIFGLRRRVTSVRESVLYLGLYRVRNLVSLFVLASRDDAPVALIDTATLRARMCELLALRRGEPHADRYFTVGLFSCLDALLHVPMEVALQHLPLEEDLVEALTQGSGGLGEVLGAVLAYEAGEWESVRVAGVERGQIRECFLEAAEFVRQGKTSKRNCA
jgi:c-di-GMP phosphodiesterase